MSFIEKLEKADRLFFTELMKIFPDDRQFIEEIKNSDDKFRDQIYARITCLKIPFSFALRDALVDQRNESRIILVNKRYLSLTE